MGGNELQPKLRFVFVTHYAGLPLHGSPLMFLHPPFLCRTIISRPHPFGKGRGGCSCVLACEVAGVFLVEATSLNIGEGLVAG